MKEERVMDEKEICVYFKLIKEFMLIDEDVNSSEKEGGWVLRFFRY